MFFDKCYFRIHDTALGCNFYDNLKIKLSTDWISQIKDAIFLQSARFRKKSFYVLQSSSSRWKKAYPLLNNCISRASRFKFGDTQLCFYKVANIRPFNYFKTISLQGPKTDPFKPNTSRLLSLTCSFRFGAKRKSLIANIN